ncbi:MAG TPA: sugar phosphate isomerase/epimerase [Armatimonadetes bacterium]|nr:sugar phosphate isomerase/epimerase [Armatimonadota bacterium]
MKNLISCNLASYGKYRETAWEHLPKLGITHVELPLPAPEEVIAVQAKLAQYGLACATLQAPCPLGEEEVVEKFETALDIATQMGVKVIFVSVKAGETPREIVFERLRRIGDRAAPRGIRLALETHPDLCHNGEVAAETMRGVDHPNVGLNFDTANIYFYNQGMDAVTELKKILPHVVSVHLKDTNGGYRTWYFPTLGEGVVDFPEIFRLLNGQGFYGPFTLELEGIGGEKLTLEQQQARVAQSVEYLRQIGV